MAQCIPRIPNLIAAAEGVSREMKPQQGQVHEGFQIPCHRIWASLEGNGESMNDSKQRSRGVAASHKFSLHSALSCMVQ